MMRIAAAIAACLLAPATLAQPAAAPAAQAAKTTYVHAGRLLADPASGRVETEKTIVVSGGKVVEIRDGYVGEGDVVDLSDRFVLPGLIDSHVHILFESGPDSRLNAVTQTTSDAALNGVVYAGRTLRSGFTTVIDLGGSPQAIYALRNAIAAGKIEGPRIVAAGGVAAHGGHGDIHGYHPEIIKLFASPTLCSGADDCARATRQAVQAGADIIKTASTGGVMSNTAAGLNQQMSDAELAAIVETAHRLGRKVATHAHGVDGINAALRAGVDSIEHGTYLDAESIRLMKANNTYLVPTLLAGDTVRRQAESAAWMPENVRTKAREVGPLMIAALDRARRGGVRIAFGTDSGVSPHGENAQEFALMVQAGLPPIDAIRAATVWAADHAGLSEVTGSIAPGKAADVIAVSGDPTQDVRLLENVEFVMAGGRIALNP